MEKKCTTTRSLSLAFEGIGSPTTDIPTGAECVLVKDATYCHKLNKRIDCYAIAKPEQYGACPHDSKHRYMWVPDDAVANRKANATLVRKALAKKSDDWQETADQWLVDIGGQKFDYYTGIGHRDKHDQPTAPALDDVLHSLVMDSSACEESFDDWCASFGYDSDSRKALAVYMACRENTGKLRKAGVNIEKERERLADY
jgi:hypothetical protein